ncbi:MAG: hypothetical protein RL268_573 [Pseudomonadota bacterium]|jgi:hypothetical protein
MIAVEPTLILAARLALLIIVGLAILHKIRAPLKFRGTIRSYVKGTPLAREDRVRLLAYAVLSLEVSVFALNVAAWSLPAGGALAAALFVIYAIAIAGNLARGNVLLDCGCSWGNERQPASWGLVARNLVLAGFALILALPPVREGIGLGEIVSALACSAILLLFYLITNQLIANAGRLEQRV